MSMNPNKVVMAGTGIMGASLCQVYALAGYETWGYDAFEKGIENGKHLIRLNQETMVKEGL
ncbi:MAG: 3-hydroxyacyl-CoA dehydrogenase family protein, partial [Lachnospiraceae bacterium]|nr:3-hydroxyacyl-CoA dehydrogenase family protein [Lachnospiraceae bacterium]